MKAGCIYFDTSLKEMRHGRAVRHNKFCAEIVIEKKRFRFRSKSMIACEKFLKEIISKHGVA